MDGTLNILLEQRDLGSRIRRLRFRARRIQLAGQPGSEPVVGQSYSFILQTQVVARHGQLFLESSQIEVIQADLRQDCNENSTIGFLSSAEIGLGGFESPAVTPENVNFPVHVETRTEKI